MESKTGCGYNYSALFTWFTDNKWVMFGVFLGLGFVVCFFGRKLYKPVFFIAGVVLTVAIVMIIFYTTFLVDQPA